MPPWNFLFTYYVTLYSSIFSLSLNWIHWISLYLKYNKSYCRKIRKLRQAKRKKYKPRDHQSFNILAYNFWRFFSLRMNWAWIPHPWVFSRFSKSALLKYNSHTTQLMHLKYTTQRSLVYSLSCVTITTVNFRTFSWPPNKPVPISTPHFLPTSSLPLPTSQAQGNYQSIFCLYGFAYSGHFI